MQEAWQRFFGGSEQGKPEETEIHRPWLTREKKRGVRGPLTALDKVGKPRGSFNLTGGRKGMKRI